MFLKNSGFIMIGLLILVIKIHSQPVDTLWSKLYGDQDNDQGRNVIETSDSGFIWTGTWTTEKTSSEDVCLVKTDSLGNLIWSRTYGGEYSDIGNIILDAYNGGYFIAAYSQSYGSGGYDIWLIRTNSNGDTTWTKTYGGYSNDYVFSAQKTLDECYVLAGTSQSFGNGKYDSWIIKVDSSGNYIWGDTLSFNSMSDQARSIRPTNDEGYIVTGYTVSEISENRDLWLIKLDSFGDTVWTKIYGGTNQEGGTSIVQSDDGGYLIVGYTESFGVGGQDIWVIKTDVNGTLLWTKTFGGLANDYGHIIEKTSENEFLITGYTESFGAGGQDIWILKIDNDGNLIWDKTIGGYYDDIGQYIRQIKNGNYIVIGTTSSFGNGNKDAWIIKLSPEHFNEKPFILSIEDVPNDQGKWVKVNFWRSINDTDSLIFPKVASAELYTVEIDDGSGWTAAASTAAYGKDIYSVLVPTTKDSTIYSSGLIEFRVIAAMNEGNFVSEVATGYSLDNLRPSVPEGIIANFGNSGIELKWSANTENDFKFYSIYRSTEGNLAEKLADTVAPLFTDSDILPGKNYAYAVSATDHSGNESDLSEFVNFTITNLNELSSIPTKYYLAQNFPNPFNPETTIRFGLPKAGQVKIIIFDILGRTVQELLNANLPAGHHQIVWNGTNHLNTKVSSSMYFYMIITKDFAQTRKMLISK